MLITLWLLNVKRTSIRRIDMDVKVGDIFKSKSDDLIIVRNLNPHLIRYEWLNGTCDFDIDDYDTFTKWFRLSFDSELERL